MLPLRDENPTLRPPVLTFLIIGINTLVWLLVQGLGSPRALAQSLCLFGLIPGELLGTVPDGTQVAVGPQMICILGGGLAYLTPLTSMFMHGGWMHLIGNMWFLWIFGDNVEDAFGSLRFLAFYLICGLAAAFAQVISDVDSVLPMVGASGAIGGVMGAYARMYPRARVDTLLILGFYITMISVPAVVMLGYWFLLQLLMGIPALGSASGGVAFWAHAGGFLTGLALVPLFRRKDHDHRARVRVLSRTEAAPGTRHPWR